MECSLTVTRAGVADRECECLITHHKAIRCFNIAHGFNSILDNNDYENCVKFLQFTKLS